MAFIVVVSLLLLSLDDSNVTLCTKKEEKVSERQMKGKSVTVTEVVKTVIQFIKTLITLESSLCFGKSEKQKRLSVRNVSRIWTGHNIHP